MTERKILIKIESDEDTFQRFIHLVKDLSKRNFDGKLIKNIIVSEEY